MVLVQRAQHGRLQGQIAGALEFAARQVTERGLVQDRLGGRGQPPSRRQQPRLEGRGILDAEAVEQVFAETRQPDGLAPVTVHEYVDVDDGARRQRQPHRISVQHRARTEATADLGQAPAQGAQRVVGVREEQGGESTARRRALTEQQERQHGPALATAVAVAALAVYLQARPAEQLDDQPRRPRLLRYLAVHARSDVMRPVTRGHRTVTTLVPAGNDGKRPSGLIPPS